MIMAGDGESFIELQWGSLYDVAQLLHSAARGSIQPDVGNSEVRALNYLLKLK